MNTRARMVLLIVWAILLWAGCWKLHTRHRGFPFFRHPDEPGKVEQVMTGKWNFHHPMLLLRVTKWVAEIGNVPAHPQRLVETGRSVSAAFTAFAVVALSLLAYHWRGWTAAIVAGLALTFHHQLYELSHYMKEDSALLMGVAFAVLAAACFAQRPSSLRAALLGAACAIAISGKYLGLTLLALALPILWFRGEAGRGRRIFIFVAAHAAVVTLINLPLLTDAGTFQESFEREMDFVVHGQRGMTRDIPHAQYWNVFLDNTTPMIWLGIIGFLALGWRERRENSFAIWAICAFPFVYALLLSFSPKSNDRYFLPATALFTFFGVLGIEDTARLVRSTIPERVSIPLFAIALLVLQVTGWSRTKPGWWQYDRAFQRDDAQELADWIRAELPPEAILAGDQRAGLPEPPSKDKAARGEPLPQRTYIARYASDVRFAPELQGRARPASLDELRAKGITHVVVSESAYGRFFLQSLSPQDSERDQSRRRKEFYEQLFRQGHLLWERKRGTVIYLHPGIEVYRIQ